MMTKAAALMQKEKKSDKAKMTDLPIVSFRTPKQWERWLALNHAISTGVWLMFYKKGSGIPSLIHEQALEEALCYGWIDGQLKPKDKDAYLQKFTPRRRQSIWSKRNIDHALRLQIEGKMKASGSKEIEMARADGRWEKAYDSPRLMQIPDDFKKALAKNKKAMVFFQTLNKANLYAIAWRLQTAKKPETREKRMKSILEMLSRGEKFH
jgi:uncharacterized protein YdeI (YjbR/CyaY-like superfamily)